jgi:hypothetical protein
MSLGSDWSNKIGAQPAANELDIRGILQKNEIKAQQYLEKIRAKEVADAVAFCVSEAKPYIVLNAPLSIVDSTAFAGFQAWARDQQIEARIIGINTERFHTKQDDCVALALMPN